jgi:TATA-box binding protein (TBP) (component of TFIID and TFIIIB)
MTQLMETKKGAEKYIDTRQEQDIITTTPYTISTITETSSLSSCIYLDLFYELIDPYITKSFEFEGYTYEIKYADYGNNKNELKYKGDLTYKKGKAKSKDDIDGNDTKINGKKRPVKKQITRFDNQVTLIWSVNYGENSGIQFKKNKPPKVNMKVFRNGQIQMTGLRTFEKGVNTIKCLIRLMEEMDKNLEENEHEDRIIVNKDTMKLGDMNVQLINTNFVVNFNIQTDYLHELLVNKYNMNSSYEPCIYPAVKLQYFWNPANVKHDGICHCETSCIIRKLKKPKETTPDMCKKVTLAIFQSGCIIITGGNKIEQVDECYAYICNILRHEEAHVRKRLPNLSGM